jgi:IS30 family transposase
MRKYQHLTIKERCFIHFKLLNKVPAAEIARELCRPRSTVYREISRNKSAPEYEASHADYLYRKRRKRGSSLLKQPEFINYIKACLIDKKWSPEMISGRLKKSDSHLGYSASIETIYKYIYEHRLGQYLPLKRKRRKVKRYKPKHTMPSIHDRPESIDNRESYGHWEGDLMIFKNTRGTDNLTCIYERKSRLSLIIKNNSKKSKHVLQNMAKLFTKNINKHRQNVRTITFDRGSEFRHFATLRQNVRNQKLGVYFADPGSPWQKGGVEKHNQIYRRFVPKGADINNIPDKKIEQICNWVNNMPRKILDFKTPIEVANECNLMNKSICRTSF